MPASTRAQADDEGITDSDRVSLDDPPVASSAQEEVRQIEPAAFDESATYFPLFCLCNDVPEEYFTHLQTFTDWHSRWLEITTCDPYSESILAQSKADAGAPSHSRRSPAPFLAWKPRALYEFHKTLLRPITASNQGRSSTFAYFTFLAVDATCFQSRNQDEWEIIVCSDAPDYHESIATGPRLKVFQKNIPRAMQSLGTIEMMCSTPIEIAKNCAMVSSVMPPPGMIGPPAVGREVKWRGIAGLPEPEGEGFVEVIEI